jgi:hypothetical protein
MTRPGEQALALWLPGQAADDCAGIPVDVRTPGAFARVTAYDCLNGVEQELLTDAADGHTLARGILVKDYPLLLRFIGSKR